MKELTYKEFIKRWKAKAKEHSNGSKILRDSRLLMTYTALFTEWIFIKHHIDAGISREDLNLIGTDEIMRKALKTIKNEDILLSLVYVGANDPFRHSFSLKKEAYQMATELYKNYSSDQDVVKGEILGIYEKDIDKQINRICKKVPDHIFIQHLHDLNTLLVLKIKDIKAVQVALTKKLDQMIVWDMKDNYKIYLDYIKKKKLEKATKKALKEVEKEATICN